MNTAFEVGAKGAEDLARVVVTEGPVPQCQAGDIVVRVHKFGFTANNVSYGTAGRAMAYFDFFPTGDPDTGMIPVWGYGDVVQSSCPEVPTGGRVYGYFPMAKFVVIKPVKVSGSSLIDASACRSKLAVVYNTYARCGGPDGDGTHLPELEEITMVARPLFRSLRSPWPPCQSHTHAQPHHDPNARPPSALRPAPPSCWTTSSTTAASSAPTPWSSPPLRARPPWVWHGC
jgi:hypothetical protein